MQIGARRLIPAAGFILMVVSIISVTTLLYARGMIGMRGAVPRVDYIEPASDSVIDIKGKDKVVFRWQMVPIPSGGRRAYSFILNKEPGYNTIAKATLDPGVYSTEVPADKFEDGARYSWHVKQRDDTTMDWSLYDIWYFTVVKK